jgi:hypothetical protein
METYLELDDEKQPTLRPYNLLSFVPLEAASAGCPDSPEGLRGEFRENLIERMWVYIYIIYY